jgi:hypothetical protein
MASNIEWMSKIKGSGQRYGSDQLRIITTTIIRSIPQFQPILDIIPIISHYTIPQRLLLLYNPSVQATKQQGTYDSVAELSMIVISPLDNEAYSLGNVAPFEWTPMMHPVIIKLSPSSSLPPSMGEHVVHARIPHSLITYNIRTNELCILDDDPSQSFLYYHFMRDTTCATVIDNCYVIMGSSRNTRDEDDEKIYTDRSLQYDPNSETWLGNDVRHLPFPTPLPYPNNDTTLTTSCSVMTSNGKWIRSICGMPSNMLLCYDIKTQIHSTIIIPPPINTLPASSCHKDRKPDTIIALVDPREKLIGDRGGDDEKRSNDYRGSMGYLLLVNWQVEHDLDAAGNAVYSSPFRLLDLNYSLISSTTTTTTGVCYQLPQTCQLPLLNMNVGQLIAIEDGDWLILGGGTSIETTTLPKRVTNKRIFMAPLRYHQFDGTPHSNIANSNRNRNSQGDSLIATKSPVTIGEWSSCHQYPLFIASSEATMRIIGVI